MDIREHKSSTRWRRSRGTCRAWVSAPPRSITSPPSVSSTSPRVKVLATGRAAPLSALFAPKEGADLVSEAVLDMRWQARGTHPSGAHLNYRLTLGPAGQIITLDKILDFLRDAGVTRRIGVDLERHGADWQRVRPRLEAALASLSPEEARACIVCVKTNDTRDLKEIHELTRRHDVGVMLIGDLALISPERRAAVRRFDVFWFDESGDRTERATVLRSVVHDASAVSREAIVRYNGRRRS